MVVLNEANYELAICERERAQRRGSPAGSSIWRRNTPIGAGSALFLTRAGRALGHRISAACTLNTALHVAQPRHNGIRYWHRQKAQRLAPPAMCVARTSTHPGLDRATVQKKTLTSDLCGSGFKNRKIEKYSPQGQHKANTDV